ncbi:MAG: hypothetical protein V4773_13510 [Verrucomicrobiota bacterium]
MLSKILSALGVAPKTLPQATETLGEAKTTLDSVAALFTAAGLNLEQILAAGSESLKAHIESLDNTTELAEALQENEALSTKLAQSEADVLALSEINTTITGAIGLPVTNETKAADIKTAFAAHVSKQTTLALAKTGHPAAHVPASAIDDITPPKTSEDATAKAALASYEALIVADNAARTPATAQAKLDFYKQNHALIDRGLTLRRRS